MGKLQNLIGKRFNRLTVISYAGQKDNNATWNCVCICGNTHVSTTRQLNYKDVQSCGCLGKEKLLLRTKHGYSKTGNKSPEYVSWNHMMQRCTNPKHKHYLHYGGRGITVCPEWLIFQNFVNDMGDCPEGKTTVERKDVNLGYFKENCIWESKERQHYNTRVTIWITYNDEKKCLMDWCKEFGLNYSKTRYWLRKGGSPDVVFKWNRCLISA